MKRVHAVYTLPNADSLKPSVDKTRLSFLLIMGRKIATLTVLVASQSGEDKVEVFMRFGGSG